MSEKYTDDADWATAAEQSSEDDEAQEGNTLAAEERSVEAAEHVALHIEGDDEDEDSDTGYDADADAYRCPGDKVLRFLYYPVPEREKKQLVDAYLLTKPEVMIR